MENEKKVYHKGIIIADFVSQYGRCVRCFDFDTCKVVDTKPYKDVQYIFGNIVTLQYVGKYVNVFTEDKKQ